MTWEERKQKNLVREYRGYFNEVSKLVFETPCSDDHCYYDFYSPHTREKHKNMFKDKQLMNGLIKFVSEGKCKYYIYPYFNNTKYIPQCYAIPI